MSNVIDLPVITKADLDPDRLLEAAKGQLDYVVIVGKTVDGEEYLAMSTGDCGDAVWNLERAKLRLLREGDE